MSRRLYTVSRVRYCPVVAMACRESSSGAARLKMRSVPAVIVSQKEALDLINLIINKVGYPLCVCAHTHATCALSHSVQELPFHFQLLLALLANRIIYISYLGCIYTYQTRFCTRPRCRPSGYECTSWIEIIIIPNAVSHS